MQVPYGNSCVVNTTDREYCLKVRIILQLYYDLKSRENTHFLFAQNRVLPLVALVVIGCRFDLRQELFTRSNTHTHPSHLIPYLSLSQSLTLTLTHTFSLTLSLSLTLSPLSLSSLFLSLYIYISLLSLSTHTHALSVLSVMSSVEVYRDGTHSDKWHTRTDKPCYMQIL